MNVWALKGLLTRVTTTRYPARDEAAPGVTPGRPLSAPAAVAARCPTGALRTENGRAAVEFTRCVHCFRCVRGSEPVAEWLDDYEWARFAPDRGPLPSAFRRSIHVRVVDTGDCGACLAELMQLESPDYSLHRLGIYITPSPRDADVLLVVGPVTNAMRAPLEAAYEAMPEPKRVVAVGACAASGGLFGPSFECDAGAAGTVPVDLVVPGCPPPPLAVLHGLLAIMGRKPAQRGDRA
jgi:Ni,Fe-hydrogenase III small subunit